MWRWVFLVVIVTFFSFVCSAEEEHLDIGRTLLQTPINIDNVVVETCAVTEPRQIFYNRIGKAGSSTLKNWVRDQGRQSKITITEGGRSNEFMTMGGELEWIQILTGDKKYRWMTGRNFYDHHVFFVDFERYGEPQPTYINMLRDPVDRYVSQYTFWRQLGDIGPPIREKNIDLEQCLVPGAHQKFGCPPPNYQTMYLCGHGPPCTDPPNEASFQRAMLNLVHRYAAVGILERWDESTAVFNSMFPTYFPTRLPGYGSSHQTNKSAMKRATYSAEVMKKIRMYNSFDQRLYDAANVLLNKRIWACQEKNT